MSIPTPTPQTQEEIRVEMKGRFDAFNAAAEVGRQRSRDAGARTAIEENRRWVKPEAKVRDVYELGENDSLGG